MSKELNPSPKFPTGEQDEKVIEKVLGVSYGELSPNPAYKDGYIKGEHGVGEPTNPNQEPKKQVAGVGLSEEDVIALIKRYTENTKDSYPVADDILEIDGETHELTPEIKAFVDKCFKAQKVSYFSSLLNLSFACVTTNYENYCYGCLPTIGHEQTGMHVEIAVDLQENKYNAYLAEL